MEALALIFALLCSTASVYLIVREARATGEWVTPWSLVLALSAIDVFVPGAVFVAWGVPDLPPWVHPPDGGLLLEAMVTHATMLGFFRIAYLWTSRGGTQGSSGARETYELNVLAAYIALALAGLIYAAYLQSEVEQAGSVSEYLTQHLKARWVPKARFYDSLYATVVNQLQPAALPIFVTMSLVFFNQRKRYAHPFFWGWAVPSLAWIASATTFFRGTQLALFLGLLLTENQRSSEVGASHRQRKQLRVLVLALLGVGVALFAGYGIVRDYYSTEAWGMHAHWDETQQMQLRQALAGHGLVGLYSILDMYPRAVPYFDGRTLYDMLLLPIPRYIYPSKPEFYGIDDITRAMGWPETTQSAVTVTGELYANFGYLGLPLGAVYGAIFGACFRHRTGPRFRYIYAYTVTILILVSHWMAFSGFMNGLVWVPLLALVLALCVRKQKARQAAA